MAALQMPVQARDRFRVSKFDIAEQDATAFEMEPRKNVKYS